MVPFRTCNVELALGPPSPPNITKAPGFMHIMYCTIKSCSKIVNYENIQLLKFRFPKIFTDNPFYYGNLPKCSRVQIIKDLLFWSKTRCMIEAFFVQIFYCILSTLDRV